MKVFTDAEKQQLQAKIKIEQERQRVLKEVAQIEKEKEAKRSKGIISTALSYKYGYARDSFCLLIILDMYIFCCLRESYNSHTCLGPMVHY